MKEIVPYVVAAVSTLFSLIVSLVAWFAREKIHTNEQRLEEAQKHIHDLEIEQVRQSGEIQRFAQTIEMIGELRAEIAIRHATREDFVGMMTRMDRVSDGVSALRDQVSRLQALRDADHEGGVSTR